MVFQHKHRFTAFLLLVSVFVIQLLLFIASSSAQSITWQKTYDGPEHSYDEANCLSVADGKNCYIGGHTTIPIKAFLLKINEYGDTIWTKVFDSIGADITAICPADNGSCVITGYEGTVFAAKISKLGEVLWCHYYASQNVYELKRTADGGYIGCGDNGNDGYVFKLDSMGLLQWDSTYQNRLLRGVELTQNGNYLVCGYMHLGYGYLAEIDNAGRIVWEKQMNSNIPNIIRMSRINSGFLLGGSKSDTTGSPYARAYLITIDTNGNQIKLNTYYSSLNEHLVDLRIINPNKYIVLTNRDSAATFRNSRIMIIDSALNFVKGKIIFDNRGRLHLNALQEAPESNAGDLIFAGSTGVPTFDDVYAIRIDSSLDNLPLYGIENEWENAPASFFLFQNHPNPFNPTTTIKFDLLYNGSVKFAVYDVLGKEIYTLNENMKAGTHQIEFDGASLASGIYFYRLEAKSFTETKKMVLLK
jgi:hypothetical protein